MPAKQIKEFCHQKTKTLTLTHTLISDPAERELEIVYFSYWTFLNDNFWKVQAVIYEGIYSAIQNRE